MADKGVSETLDEFLDTLIDAENGCRGCLYELALAVERRTAGRCAEIADRIPSDVAAGTASAIRHEFWSQPNE